VTPEEEATFIVLWQQGLTTDAIAEALGIPKGTARSRAYTLQQQGKIQPRPKGGRRERRRPDNLPTRAPAQAPALPPADASLPTREAPAITFMAVPEVRELIHTVNGLAARVAALENDTRGTAHTPPAPAGPPAPTRTPGTIKQWTVRLSQPLIDSIKEQARTEGKEPSHLVEELLWQALTDRRASTN
jgi:hypothetical protein